MITLLKQQKPTARKEYRCMYCGCVIPAGEKYRRDTFVYDGQVYDWVSHEDCCKAADLLGMFDRVDEGLDDCSFREYVDEYLYEHYTDPATDDIRPEVAGMSTIEQVRLIISDWDTPRFKIPRLKGQLDAVEVRIKAGGNLSEYWLGRRKELKAELEKTGNINENQPHTTEV